MSNHHPSPRARAFSFIVFAIAALSTLSVLFFSCGVLVPEPSEIRSWAVEPAVAPTVAAIPLEVLVKNPVGQISVSQAINVVFNQAVVPLSDLDAQKAQAAKGLKLSPPLEGDFHWLGTSTLSFIPSAGFQPATRYTVTVPVGFTSLQSTTLAAEHTWTFDTDRPAVASSTPYSGQSDLEPNQVISLTFTQPIDFSSLTSRVHLIAPGGEEVPISLRPADPSKPDEAKRLTDESLAPEQLLIVTPNAPLALDSTFTIRVDAGLLSKLGPLPGEVGFSSTFSTYEPFSVNALTCGYSDCTPTSEIRLSLSNGLAEDLLSNPPTPAQLAALISVSPPVEVTSSYVSWDRSSITLHYKFAPDTAYAFTVHKGQRDRFGQTLSEDFKQTIAVGSFSPALRISSGTGVLEPSLIQGLPGVAMNFDTVQVRTLRLTEADLIATQEDLWEVSRRDAMFARATPAQKPWSSAIKLTGKRNSWRLFDIPFSHSLGDSGKGVLLYDLYPLPLRPQSYGTPVKEHRYGIIQATDIGLTTKLSPDETLVWVTSLTDAKPIGGVTVKLRDHNNAIVWTGTSDAQGLARGPGLRSIERPNSYSPLLITAHRGDELAFINVSEGDYELRPWHFNVPYQWDWKDFRYAVHAFTDRGVYRSGDTVHVKGTIREDIQSQWAIPADARFFIKVYDSRDQEVLSQDGVALSAFGGFTFDLPLAADAPLGSYTIAIHDKPITERWEVTHSTNFRVEAYRAPEFKVKVDAPASVIAGEPLTATAQGDYLFGAPMSGASVAWTALRYRAFFSPPGEELSGFSFNENHKEEGGDYSTLTDERALTLDASGASLYELTVPVGSLPFPMRYTLDADVRDLNRQSVASSASVFVHPGDRYLGIGFDGYIASTEKPVTLQYLSVTPAGARVGGVEGSVQVFQRTWSTTREQSGEDGWYYRSTYEDKPVGGCVLTSSAAAPVDCQVSLSDSGPGYYIARVEGKDSRGVALSSSTSFYAYGKGRAFWEYRNDSTVELVADRANYKPGDSARILIKSPWEEATALITTERSGVLTTEVRTLSSNAETFTLDVAESHIPNVFVSVVLLQGRTAAFDPQSASDPGRPAMRLGYLSLPVAVEQRRLAVDVDVSAEEVLPGGDAQVTLRVKDFEGKGVKAEVALYAVDEGVLSLTGYQTPNPMEVFYKPRPLGVNMSDSRFHFFELSHKGLKGDDSAGDGDSGEDAGSFRSVFSTTPLWMGQLVTADDGTASVTVKMPENLTTFRVMAVATSAKAQFGNAQDQVRVSKPLLVRSALPRFARIDDTFEASVIINNRAAEAATVTLKMDVDAAFLQPLEPQERQVIVEPGRGKEVRFKVRALQEGKPKVRFSITPQGATTPSDGVEVALRVLTPAVTETVATSGIVEQPILERLRPPDRIHAAVGGLDVSLSSTALIDLSESLRYVVDYPFGCAEQMSSKLIALVSLRPLLSSFNLLDLTEASLDATAASIIERLVKQQDWSGGFSMWPNSGGILDHGSVYVMHALSLARARGVAVDADVISQGASYLQRIATSPQPFTSLTSLPSWNTIRAYALYVLATLDQPDRATLSTLFEARAQLNLIGRSYLLLALAASDADPAQVEAVTQELINAAAIDTHGVYFGDPLNHDLGVIWSSDVRSTSLALMALTISQPEHPLLPKITAWLQAQRANGRWANTQDNAFGSLALLSYFERFEAVEPNYTARLFLGGDLRFEQPFVGRSQSVITHHVPMRDVAVADNQDLVLDRVGQGRLYYAMRLTYAPADMPLPPREEGFTILRRYEDLKTGKELSSFSAGDVVKVRLTIIAPRDREEVAVRDHLPAGLEPISLDFQTASAALNFKMSQSEASQQHDYDWYWRPDFDHIEKRDDVIQMFASYLPAGVYEHAYLARATTFGTFSAPAAQAEEMYSPEVFGRSSSLLLDVK
jgi:alpha-2-macroglobulin